MEPVVRLYWKLGLSNKEILACMAQRHGIVISIRTLKRVMKRCHLYRRKEYSDVLNVALFITDEVQNSGKCVGYKLMHHVCRQEGYVVTQETVRYLMHIIDPDGIDMRRRGRLRRRQYFNYGPNFLWHMDSYDKLKPYGICINGAIDGFSRYIVWLEAHKTSSDPKIIAGYFMNEVTKRQGCPSRIRADKGTENSHVKDMLRFMRRNHHDEYATTCFLEGSSNHNQRIERWWGTLRTLNTQHWMDTFLMLKESGSFSGDFLDKSLIQFCFMKLIQDELDEVARLWNTHQIRSSKHVNSPSGRPVIMYTCPELYGVDNYLCDIERAAVDACLEECTPKSVYCCDETVFELCELLMEECGKAKPDSAEKAVLLYQFLREEMQRGLG